MLYCIAALIILQIGSLIIIVAYFLLNMWRANDVAYTFIDQDAGRFVPISSRLRLQ